MLGQVLAQVVTKVSSSKMSTHKVVSSKVSTTKVSTAKVATARVTATTPHQASVKALSVVLPSSICCPPETYKMMNIEEKK